MNERRATMVSKVFNTLDKDGSGKITVSSVQDFYDVTYHPEFKKGNMTRDQLLTRFLSRFDSARTGSITHEDFFNYYTDVSMTFTLDNDFINLLQNSWCIAEDDVSKVF